MNHEVRSISKSGLELIKSFEALSLTAYLCPANIPTIGWGHTGKDVAFEDVGSRTISLEEAERLLREDVKTAEEAVNRLVTLPIAQHRFDALCSLVFNIGSGSFEKSTLLKKLNCGDFQGAAFEFTRWVHSGGEVLPGLIARRRAERALFEADLQA